MTTERDKILSKIRALLAKTLEAGATEAEAMAALEKAQAIKDAHEVTEAELNLTKEEKAILRGEPPGTKDPHRAKWHLMGAVSEFCGCQAWRQPASKGGGIVFCGLPSDAQFATWLLDHLTAFVLAQLTEHLMAAMPERGDRRLVMRNFVAGICDRIGERLDELDKKTEAHATSNAKALVVVKGAAIAEKMKELDIHVSGVCSGGGAFDLSSYRAGRVAGDRASFGRPVSGRGGTLRLK